MSIPARSEAEQQLTFRDPFVDKTQVIINGAARPETSTTVTRVAHSCGRSNLKKSGFRVDPSTGKRYRPSTSYDRNVYDVTGVRPQEYEQSSTTSTSRYRYVKHVVPEPADIAYVNQRTFNGSVPLVDENGKNESIVKALNNLGDQKVNISVALAEARSTYNMLAKSVIPMLRALLAAKQNRWDEIPKILRWRKQTRSSSEGIFLEWKYGWLPLAGDIKGTYDLLVSLKHKPLELEAEGFAKRTTNVGGAYRSSSFDGEIRHSYFTKLKAQVTADSARKFNQAGLINPFTLGWELIPFSFVIDWVLPVGNVLEAYSATAGLQFVDGYTGMKMEGVVKSTTPVPSNTATTFYTGEPGKANHAYFRYSRVAHGGFPQPRLYHRQNWFSLEHGITALALFKQLRR